MKKLSRVNMHSTTLEDCISVAILDVDGDVQWIYWKRTCESRTSPLICKVSILFNGCSLWPNSSKCWLFTAICPMQKTIMYKYNIRLLCILEKPHLFSYTKYRQNVIHVYTKNGRLVKVRPLDTPSIRWGDTLIQTIIRKEETWIAFCCLNKFVRAPSFRVSEN